MSGEPAIRRAARFAIDHYLVVPFGAILAVIWANTAPEGYFGFAQSLSFVVNEIGMALFVALIAQELLEAVMPGGALHTWQRVLLPVIAAIGGAILAVLSYVFYLRLVGEVMLAAGIQADMAVRLPSALSRYGDVRAEASAPLQFGAASVELPLSAVRSVIPTARRLGRADADLHDVDALIAEEVAKRDKHTVTIPPLSVAAWVRV